MVILGSNVGSEAPESAKGSERRGEQPAPTLPLTVRVLQDRLKELRIFTNTIILQLRELGRFSSTFHLLFSLLIFFPSLLATKVP